MNPVEEFYEKLEAGEFEITSRRGRKPSKKQYFTIVTEKAIVAFNKETDQRLRNKVYREHIDYPFNKLVENIYHTFRFSYFDDPYEDVKAEVVAVLNEKIHILKARTDTTAIDESRNLQVEMSRNDYQESLNDFVTLWADWYESNLNMIFSHKRDIMIADTILEIFRMRDNIENFNKKALYILIRERTGLKTQNITKVINIMRRDFFKMYSVYQKTGRLN